MRRNLRTPIENLTPMEKFHAIDKFPWSEIVIHVTPTKLQTITSSYSSRDCFIQYETGSKKDSFIELKSSS